MVGSSSELAGNIETLVQMTVGYLVAIGFYLVVRPLFGHDVSIASSSLVAVLMLPVNLGRRLAIRRLFNRKRG